MNICENLAENLGFYCGRLPTVDDAWYISTPLTLAHGKPLDVFIFDKGPVFEITDDGLTIAELRGSGIDLSKRISWRGLERIGSKHGFTLEDDGSFTCLAKAGQLPNMMARSLQLFADICTWEQERIAENDTDLSLYTEVEQIILRHANGRKFETEPSRVFGDQTFHFDFALGDILLDAVKPNQNSINARIRKSLQINNLSGDSAQIVYVVDDRDGYKKALVERNMLGNVSKAVLLSNFANTLAA